MNNKKDTLFISYSWNDGNVYADELENQLTDYFEVKRDKSQLKYNEDMFDFMAEIANCDYVVVILSADYVKSVNCMLEASYLVQQPDWEDKAMVLVIDESIYGKDRKLELLNYWNLRKKKAEDKDSELGRSIIEEDYNNICEIDRNLEKFLYGISRKRNPSQIAIVNEFVRKKRNNFVEGNSEVIKNGIEKVKEYLKTVDTISIPDISEKLGFSEAYTSRLLKLLAINKKLDISGREGFRKFKLND